MTRDEVIQMAREAGFATSWTVAAGEALERFAELVAKAEREAIVKLTDSLGWVNSDDIRARGEV